MMRTLLILGALALAACAPKTPAPSADDQLISDAKAAVAAKLRDPASAAFAGVRVVPHQPLNYVCGTVNGKNAYGALQGPQPFVFMNGSAYVAERPPVAFWPPEGPGPCD